MTEGRRAPWLGPLAPRGRRRHRWGGRARLDRYQTKECLACGARVYRHHRIYELLRVPRGTPLTADRLCLWLPACPGPLEGLDGEAGRVPGERA